jgi:hypothetical protein
MNEFEAMSVETLRITDGESRVEDDRMSGRNVVVVWINPKKFGSNAARRTATSISVAPWGLPIWPVPAKFMWFSQDPV